MREFSITLDTKVTSGKFVLEIDNGGTLVHEIHVVSTALKGNALPYDNDMQKAFEETDGVHEIEASHPVPAGTSDREPITFTPGHYVLFCNQPGHYKSGMYLDVTVT